MTARILPLFLSLGLMPTCDRQPADPVILALGEQVVRRSDFDPASLDPWLDRFVALEKQVWTKTPPESATLDASQNARDLLRSFYALLSLPEPAAAGGQAAAREKALATLAKIRR